MKNIAVTMAFIVLAYLSTSAQNGQWLPAGLDWHEHGSDHFGGKWKLVFFDEFNTGTVLDPNKWTVTDGDMDVGAPTLSVHKPSNVKIIGGNCELKITKEDAVWTTNGQTFPYRSADIHTAKWLPTGAVGVWERGMFEARIKMSKAFWGHNNFWLFLNADINMGEVLGFNPKLVPQSTIDDNQCEKRTKINSKVVDGFHIYTAIWDKYYIYFYIDHKLSYTVPKYNFYHSNNDAQGNNDVHQTGWYSTLAGYYWKRKCVVPINSGLDLILHLFLNEKTNIGLLDLKKKFSKQDADLNDPMLIDWVRVYKRDECEESETLTNPILLPYFNLSEKDLFFGTQSSMAWANIIPTWGQTCKYEAESILIQSNFLAQAVNIVKPDNTSGTTSYLFKARTCPESNNEYIEPEISEGMQLDGDELEEDEPFDCSNLDTALVDSLVYSYMLDNDSIMLDTIQLQLDSLGCDYWPTFGNKRGQAGLPSNENYALDKVEELNKIRIYPNPASTTLAIMTKSTDYTYKIFNSVGIAVLKGTALSERFKTIDLDASLPSGNYIIHIRGKDLNHTERISIIR